MRPDRIEKQATVLLDVIDCRRDPTLKDTYLSGTTVDISETCMKLLANLQIPVATRLGLRLDFHTHLYRLEGEVRWAKGEEHCMGLQLDPKSLDYSDWIRMFELDL